MGSFLEGPSFDRAGNLYVVDLAWGRIFKVSAKGEFETIIEYDGEPNGLAIHKDGRIFIADHKHGILYLENGDLYFTDQGVSDMADPSGCVYRYGAERSRR